MAKHLKILFLIFTLGMVISSQQIGFAQETTSYEVCCCSANEEHQSNESPTECCGTSCQDCSISHTHHLSVFHLPTEEYQVKKIYVEAKKIATRAIIFLPQGQHNIWQPPKIG